MKRVHLFVAADNGIQFRYPPRYVSEPAAGYMTRMFDMRRRENCIEHRFTNINHPCTNGQVERMNRTIKDAPSSASTMTVTTSCDSYSATSSTPTTAVADSRD